MLFLGFNEFFCISLATVNSLDNLVVRIAALVHVPFDFKMFSELFIHVQINAKIEALAQEA